MIMFAKQVLMFFLTLSGLKGADFDDVSLTLEGKLSLTCYFDEFLVNKDYLEYIGYAHTRNSDPSKVPPIEVYLQSQENGARILVCIIEWSDEPREGECQWHVTDYYRLGSKYHFYMKIAVRSTFNNTQIFGIQKSKQARTNYLTDVIVVRPEPEVSLTIDSLEQNVHDCQFVATNKSFILVEFCVKFLEKPRISLSLQNDPSPSVAQECVKQEFIIKSAYPFKIMASYVDECCQFGSFTCLIKKKVVKEASAPEESTFWPIILAPVLLGTVLLAYGGFLLYKKIEADREKARKLKKLKKADAKVKSDQQFAGAIYEVYTVPPEIIDDASNSSGSS